MKTKKKAKISTKRKTNTVEDDEDEVSIIEDDTKLSQYLNISKLIRNATDDNNLKKKIKMEKAKYW